MWQISLQLFGCGEDGLKTPIELDEQSDKTSFVSDAMPLIALLDPEEANTLYPGIPYEQAAILYYENLEDLLNVYPGQVQARNTGDASQDPLEFREYVFTHDGSDRKEVYALTSGYLYYLTAGQSLPYLLGGTVIAPGESILVLKPLQTVHNHWKESHPGTLPLLEQCAYIDVSIVSDEALKILIGQGTTKLLYDKIYREIHGTDAPLADDWEAEYLALFKTNPEIPIIVSGGKQIGWTNTDPDEATQQRMTMFYSFDGNWNSTLPNGPVDTFFRYFRRRIRLSAHPLIAKLLQLPVWAGSVDVIIPYSALGARSKSKLIEEFLAVKDPAAATHHPLAIDPDQHPHRLVISQGNDVRDPYFPPEATLLQINNPLGLAISLEGNLPPEITVTPTHFYATTQVVEILVSGDLLPNAADATLVIVAEDSFGVRAPVLEIVLTFMHSFAVPVKFYKLRNDPYAHITDMDETKLREVISCANEILRQQANVTIYPVEDENGAILHDFLYNGGDLGNPIVLYDFLPGYDGVEDIWQQMAGSSEQENARVLFVWNQEAGESLGATFRPGGLGKLWAMMLMDTQPLENFNASVEYLAKILVHELGHWFSITFIRWQNGEDECTARDEHFRHGTCPGGHWELWGNLMTKNPKDLWITQAQASVYNDFAIRVLP